LLYEKYIVSNAFKFLVALPEARTNLFSSFEFENCSFFDILKFTIPFLDRESSYYFIGVILLWFSLVFTWY